MIFMDSRFRGNDRKRLCGEFLEVPLRDEDTGNDMLFNLMVGCGIFLITNLSLLYASHLVVRRFMRQCPAPARLAGSATIPYACIILLFQALSPFHAISRLWVTVSCLVVAGLCHILWGRHRDFSADLEPLSIWLRDGIRSRWAVLMVMCGFVLLLSLSRALLMPPLAWDCLTYHLTFATLFLKKGALVLFKAPDQIAYAGLFPINGEIFASWLLLPFGTDVLLNALNFPFLLLGVLCCYAIARELGLSRKEAAFAPALIMFAPVIYVQVTTEYLDIATLTFCCASVLFTLRYLRQELLIDCVLALVAAGILLGLKYNAIPAVGIIVLALFLKALFFSHQLSFFKKAGVILAGIAIVLALGGRQYIVNLVEANNPLYPFPVRIADHELFEGSLYLEQVKNWIQDYEQENGWDKFSLWEKEYRKFCYLATTAGPKFLIFLVLAVASFFARPRYLSRGAWLFLSVIWTIPVAFFYLNTTTDFARRAYWTDGSFRFLSPYIALCTIQGMLFIKRIKGYTRAIDFILVALIAWDLLYINKTHLWEVTVAYPFIVLTALIGALLLSRARERAVQSIPEDSPSRVRRRRLVYAAAIILFGAGLYGLQSYRDSTRYQYYRVHQDLHDFPRNFVDAWEFLDRPGEKKTIALSAGWDPPSHKWFFYPLFGRWLQNDVEYLSAKHKWEVPTWVDRGMLRGDDYSIWLYNVKAKKVNYILVEAPWPVEMSWMLRDREQFRLVFSNNDCKIFGYTGSS